MQLPDLDTKYLGKVVEHYETIDSTQLEIERRIQKGIIQNGTIIIADIQTEGKRYTWKSMAYRSKKQYCVFILCENKLQN